jgi:formylglycine-generating enzyme required for sulfatase activity
MEFVQIKAGKFIMGDTKGEKDEAPHEVTLTRDYWMQSTETTQAQWESVMRSNPSYHEGENLPVEKVSWEDCQEFLRKLGTKVRDQLKVMTASPPARP